MGGGCVDEDNNVLSYTRVCDNITARPYHDEL